MVDTIEAPQHFSITPIRQDDKAVRPFRGAAEEPKNAMKMRLHFSGISKLGELTVAALSPGAADASMLPGCPFLCGVILTQDWHETWLRGLLHTLLMAGAVYFVFWGLRCEQAHDIADSVRDTLCFLAFSAIPTDTYLVDEKRYLVLDINGTEDGSILHAARAVFS